MINKLNMKEHKYMKTEVEDTPPVYKDNNESNKSYYAKNWIKYLINFKDNIESNKSYYAKNKNWIKYLINF